MRMPKTLSSRQRKEVTLSRTWERKGYIPINLSKGLALPDKCRLSFE